MTAESITLLLKAAQQGDPGATNALFDAVYAELQRLAGSHRRRWQGNHTMNTTSLVHEVYLKLAGSDSPQFANRTHFFATASRAMRQVLVNYAEQQGAGKRGGHALRVPLEDSTLVTEVSPGEMLDLHRALELVEADDPRRGRIAECRIFAGMTVDEIAEALDISPATVKREWQIASALMYSRLGQD